MYLKSSNKVYIKYTLKKKYIYIVIYNFSYNYLYFI